MRNLRSVVRCYRPRRSVGELDRALDALASWTALSSGLRRRSVGPKWGTDGRPGARICSRRWPKRLPPELRNALGPFQDDLELARNAVTVPCKHCDGDSEGSLGDGLCHNGSRRQGERWLPQSEWNSCQPCRDAHTRRFGTKQCGGLYYEDMVVPCRYCNGHGVYFVLPDGTPVRIALPEDGRSGRLRASQRAANARGVWAGAGRQADFDGLGDRADPGADRKAHAEGDRNDGGRSFSSQQEAVPD